MIRRVWQSAMIALARSPRIKSFVQSARSTSFLAKNYVAGETPGDGVARAKRLLEQTNIRSSLFYMGEYVDTPEFVQTNSDNIIQVAETLRNVGIDVHISVDPTQIGHQIKPGLASENAEVIARSIRDIVGNTGGVNCLMFDMEDASLNDPTIAIHNKLQDLGYPVALTLQAYLKRTIDDIRAQVRRGSKVRLVKGAFAAGSDIAYTKRSDIKRNSQLIIDIMFSGEAKDSGFYPILATHDTNLQEYAIEQAGLNGWAPGEYEFEMLLGVREEVAKRLAQRGQRVRVYVPFGKDWWPYAVRRIGETPANAVLLIRSLIG